MPNKIDRRIRYRIVLDTETAPLDRSVQGVSPDNMLAYDFGWAVVDKKGRVYKTRSFVNADVFLYEKTAMTSSYYADKIPMYWEQIKSGERTLAKYNTICRALREDIAEYEVTEIWAHNMRFDNGATNNTARWLTKSKFRYFFPYGIAICDSLKASRDVLGKMPTYLRFCEKNGYMTKSGKPRFTAEIIYRFISGDNSFIESHTGLEDVMIEKEIVAYCYRQHKPMRKLLWEKK